MTAEDVPDSTDWLPTPLSQFAAVENALRCQVCKDFYNTPMITSCCHTFCSLCIRRALASDSKCPLCRATEQEAKLRSNWTLEEAVESFTKARASAIGFARDAAVDSKKRKAGATPSEQGAPSEPKRLRTSARLNKGREAAESTLLDAVRYIEVQDSDDESAAKHDTVEQLDDDFVPEPDDGLVPCPSCQTRMKDWQVFRHLEACPGPTKPKERSPVRNVPNAIGPIQRTHTKTERLPVLTYGILKDTALRRKMAELGLSSSGTRSALEKRHREWVNVWNANCDAARPKTRRELLRELDTWERAQQGAFISAASANSQAAIKSKGFDGAAWASKHDDSFRNLIASARKSGQQARQNVEEKDTEEEDTSLAGGSKSTKSLEAAPQRANHSGGSGVPLVHTFGVSLPSRYPQKDEAAAESRTPISGETQGHHISQTPNWEDPSFPPVVEKAPATQMEALQTSAILGEGQQQTPAAGGLSHVAPR